jgi:hypothetical protein
MDRTHLTYRMGRKRRVKLLVNLQSILNRARRVNAASRGEQQQKIKTVKATLTALLNVIQHRGNHGPARWPRERKRRRRPSPWSEQLFE